jgi:hypothetical protein
VTLTTGRDFGWMKKHCTQGSPARVINAPFCLKGNGVNYAVASNGCYLVAVTLYPGEPPPFPFDPVDDIVLKYIEDGPTAKTCVTPKELMEWIQCQNCNNVDIVRTCTKCRGSKTQRCSDCNGDGKVGCLCGCGNTHRRNCDACRGKETETCAGCDGRGTIGCCCKTTVDIGSIKDVATIDRRFLRAAISDLPLVWGKKILTSYGPTGSDAVKFYLDGWLMVVMPTTAEVGRGQQLNFQPIEVLDALTQV